MLYTSNESGNLQWEFSLPLEVSLAVKQLQYINDPCYIAKDACPQMVQEAHGILYNL